MKNWIIVCIILMFCISANGTILLFKGFAVDGNHPQARNLNNEDLLPYYWNYGSGVSSTDVFCSLDPDIHDAPPAIFIDFHWLYAEGHGWTPNVTLVYSYDGEGSIFDKTVYMMPKELNFGGLEWGLVPLQDAAKPLEITFTTPGTHVAKIYGFTVGVYDANFSFSNVPWKIVDAANNQLAGGSFTVNAGARVLNIPVDANVVKAAELKLVIDLTGYSNPDKFIFGNIDFGEEKLAAHAVLTFDNADGSIIGGGGEIPQDYGDKIMARPQNGFNYGGNDFVPDVNVSYIDPADGSYMFGWTTGYNSLVNVVGGWLCDVEITFTGLNGKQAVLYGFDLGVWPVYADGVFVNWTVRNGTTILDSGEELIDSYMALKHVSLDPAIAKANTLILTAWIEGDQYGNFGIDNVIFDQSPSFEICGDSEHPIRATDLNRDCYVDAKDLAIMAEEWMSCTNPGSPCN